MKELEEDKEFSEIKKNYKHIAVRPGERTNYDAPEFQKGKNGIQKFIVNYRLRNGCDQCMLLGYLKLAFDFDSTGKFMSTEIVSITNATVNANRTVDSWIVKNIFGDPSKPVDVDAGEKFVIVLPSNHSAGYKWQLANPINASHLRLVGTDYRKPYEMIPGAPGKETWTFEAGNKGTTIINFEYSPAWQSGGNVTKKVTFNVNIN
jgi:predicted secreted protein